MLLMGIGFIRTWAGPGLLTTPGDGQHSIMEDGSMMAHSDGCGFVVRNGHQPGLAGERVPNIMDGRLWVPI